MDIRRIRLTPSTPNTADLTSVNRVVIGVKPYVADGKDQDSKLASLGKPVADYPAMTKQDGGNINVSAALEYGTQIGVHELGLYADDEHVATLQAKHAQYAPLFALQTDFAYLLKLAFDLTGKLTQFTLEAHDELTYAMILHSWQSGVKSAPQPVIQVGDTAIVISRDKPNDLKFGSDNGLVSQPPDVDFLAYYILQRG